MIAIVARHLPETDATISFKDGYPPMAPTAGNRALLDRLNLINADLGLKPMPPLDPLKRGAGDISFVAPMPMALSGSALPAMATIRRRRPSISAPSRARPSARRC